MGPVVRALALKSRDPKCKTCSDHLWNLFPGSHGLISWLRLLIANWFASASWNSYSCSVQCADISY